ncbi:hypothetical protein MTO96_026478 [Rhipicephalus appendiculatus]
MSAHIIGSTHKTEEAHDEKRRSTGPKFIIAAYLLNPAAPYIIYLLYKTAPTNTTTGALLLLHIAGWIEAMRLREALLRSEAIIAEEASGSCTVFDAQINKASARGACRRDESAETLPLVPGSQLAKVTVTRVTRNMQMGSAREAVTQTATMIDEAAHSAIVEDSCCSGTAAPQSASRVSPATRDGTR